MEEFLCRGRCGLWLVPKEMREDRLLDCEFATETWGYVGGWVGGGESVKI